MAALAILDRLDVIDVDTLAWWLSERQLPSGGLNGRPEKLEDVSHSLLAKVMFLHAVHDTVLVTDFPRSKMLMFH